MKPSDTQLIASFTEQGDQAAFTQLVDRYVDVAYSAAVTLLRTDDLAHDACQLTFVELARKAGKLSENVKLGGWIYTTSRNISRKIQRGEIRRFKREQDYADQMKMQNSPEIDWAKLSPEIHEALERLKPADRDSIILRYFQHKSLAETGAALGLSADAARMRLTRALDRLNKQLSRKGITSTAAALAAALPAHAAHTAPAGLAKTISAAALTKAGAATAIGISTLTGIGVMSTKTLIISASVAATALVGGTIYLTNRPGDAEAPAAPVVSGTSDAPAKTAAPAAPVQAAPQEVAPDAGTDPALPEAGAAGEIITVAGNGGTFDPRAAIGPQKLQEAEQILDMISLAMAMGAEGGGPVQVITPADLAEQTDTLVEKLSLRLGLTPEQKQAFSEILEENRQAVTGGLDPQAMIESLLTMDREKASEFLALQTMDPQALQDPQLSAYSDSLQEEVTQAMGIDPDVLAGEPAAPWNKNSDVLDKLSAQLSQQQQDELLTYVEEQELRGQEKRAYDRSARIANQLGLTEEDRGLLFDRLYENPGMTDEDIKEMLDPELHGLMNKSTGQELILPVQ